MVLFVVAVCAALAASPASAYIINLTTNTPVFYDGFESQPSNLVSHANYPDAMNALPVAAQYGGWWSTLNLGDPARYHQVQVTDYESGTFFAPGAYEGDNYLRLRRVSPDSYVQACQNFATTSFATGDIFHWEQMVYLAKGTTNTSNEFFVRFNTVLLPGDDPTNTYPPALISIKSHGGSVQYDVNDAAKVTGMTVAYNTWQKWEVDYVVGSDKFTLTLDGVVKADLGINKVAYQNQALSFVAMRSGPNVTDSIAYIDETFTIPEPSTFALLGMGLIGLLCYAWRKRKI
ncbi:MAG: PEP-CTERM sorting domain-containing protein [Pirellulaceae bacterium]|nr:PEP-CTERM sorting domain-containing protein [Pirellulaceae bacterium]